MTTVMVIVTLDTEKHSFVETPLQARAVIENILRRDPRFNINHMTVSLAPSEPEVTYRRDRSVETAGDNLHNIFEDSRGNRNDFESKHVSRGEQ